jgi:hypothetical protein
VGPEDEASGGELNVAEEQGVLKADGVDVGLGRMDGDERVVVAVNDDDVVGGEQRLHGAGLAGCEADGDEAFPIAGAGRLTAGEVAQGPGGELEAVGPGVGVEGGVVESGGLRDEGDRVRGRGRASRLRCDGGGEEIFHAESESGENAVKSCEAEAAPGVEEVGDVGLLEAALPSERGGCDEPAIDAANEFHTQPLMQLKEVHAVGVAKELYTSRREFCPKASLTQG